MHPTTRQFLSAALLLMIVFSAVHLRVAYPPAPKPIVGRDCANMRPLVPDSVLYDFVRQLLAQADAEPPRPYVKPKADFWISRVLLEHAPIGLNVPYPKSTTIRYRYGETSASVLNQLYAEHVLSAADTAFMRQQIARSVDFKLNPDSLLGYKIISVELLRHRLKRPAAPDVDFFTVMDQLKREHQTQSISFLSAPLFSRNGRWAVTTVTLNTGTFCGVGNTVELVMENVKGRWRKVRATNY